MLKRTLMMAILGGAVTLGMGCDGTVVVHHQEPRPRKVVVVKPDRDPDVVIVHKKPRKPRTTVIVKEPRPKPDVVIIHKD
jgi:uncharacterized protein YcfJ